MVTGKRKKSKGCIKEIGDLGELFFRVIMWPITEIKGIFKPMRSDQLLLKQNITVTTDLHRNTRKKNDQNNTDLSNIQRMA